MGEIIPDYLGVPNIITCLLMGREVCQRENRCEDAILLALKMKGSGAKEHRRPLKAGKYRQMDSLLVSLKGTQQRT